MKHILLVIISIGMALCLRGQDHVLADYLQNAGDNASLYYGRIEQQSVLTSVWRGHPYWEDTEYHCGDICYDGVTYTSVMMRYNILANELVVVTPERQVSVVPDPDKINYFVVDGKKFVRVDGWFMCIEADGAYDLLYARTKRQGPDDIIDHHLVHNILSNEQYYLRDPEGRLSKVSSLKHLCRVCPDCAEQLKALKKARRLKFDKASRAHDLKECVALINSLHPESDAGIQQSSPQVITQVTALENIPDSVFASITVPESLPAYKAYSAKTKPLYEFADDDPEASTPGIESLDPTRETRLLDEVEVTAIKHKAASKHTGMESFRPALLRNVPMAMGENDVLKMALMLPGVSSTGEASSGLNVRGGGSDQNLTLYNGNTVFNPTHMFGLFSAFNSDMIAETELFKGSLPSQYGGRLSSVMNINGRTASKEKFGGSASIGLVTSKVMLELPVIKNRASLLVGGRTTYSDWMLQKLPESSGYKNGKAGFWDVSSTLSCKIGASGNMLVSGYYSQDRFSFTDFDKYGYSNLNTSAEYRTRIGDRTSIMATAGYDHYDYTNDNIEDDLSAARLTFALNQIFLRTSATHQLNDNHSIRAGLQTQYNTIMPGKYVPIGELSHVVGRQLSEERAIESALFAEDTWTMSKRLSIVAGLRLNVFNALREGKAWSAADTQQPAHTDKSKAYINPDLRLSANYKIAEAQTLKLGLNTQHQYIHKVSNTVIMSPTDTWMLSNALVKPQRGWQASVGYFWQNPSRVYEVSVEAYYKGMANYLTYRSGAQLVMNPNLEDDVVGTRGKAYGIELQLSKYTGKLNGWVSYSYSQAMLRQTKPEGGTLINDGAWFPADYDSPHAFKLVGNYKFTRRYSMSLNVDYSTGRPYTAPVAQYYDHQHGIIVPLYSERNQVRMPDYFRVDWSFNIEPSHHLTNLTHSWLTIGVYNLLGRKNAYSIYFQYDKYQIHGYKLSIFGAPIPYISYNIRF